ncbi:MAG TPA: CAP domain-containing protein [Actinomycetales bacterium]|nr:CAP domain-containing protein [Actinomycetales bacterium]
MIQRKVIGAVAAAGVAVLTTGGAVLMNDSAASSDGGQASDAVTQSPATSTTSALPTGAATTPSATATSPTAVPTSPATKARTTSASRDLSAARAKPSHRTTTAARTTKARTTTKAKPKPKPTTRTTTVSSSGSSTYESQLLSLVNRERTSRGLAPLAAASCPDRYAESWAAHLASTGEFAHQSLSPIMSACGATRAAENIARGNISASAMVALWMGSPGHRANILDPRLTQVGTAAVKDSSGAWTAVQDFIRP